MTNQYKRIQFIAKVSRSGTKRLLNIPKDLFRDLDKSVEYYKIYMIPIRFNDLNDLEQENKDLKKKI